MGWQKLIIHILLHTNCIRSASVSFQFCFPLSHLNPFLAFTLMNISSRFFFFFIFSKLISPLPSLSLLFLIPGFSYPSIQPVSWILFLLSVAKKKPCFLCFSSILFLPVQTTLNAKAIAQSEVETLYKHFSNIFFMGISLIIALKIMLYLMYIT